MTNRRISRVGNRSEYERLGPSGRENYHRSFEVLAEMRREGISLHAASRRVGTTPATVLRYAGDLLVKESGRYRPTSSDRSYHRMSVLSTGGLRDVDTRGSRTRSVIGGHWNAIHRFAATGDVAVFRPFAGKRVAGVELATDPDQIEEYLRQGELDIDDIYV
jgi:hypothetical protein